MGNHLLSIAQMKISILTKNFSSHTLDGKIDKSYWLWSRTFYSFSMSVCDEKFFVNINIYHSDVHDSLKI